MDAQRRDGYRRARLAKGGPALRARGPRVRSPLGDVHLPEVRVTDDLVLFGVWDTRPAAASVKPPLGEHTAVVSFQNGVVKDAILRDALGGV